MTGSRVARVAKYIDTDTFCLTYGDGLADINIYDELQFHNAHGKLVTLTGVNLPSRFGNLELNRNQVTSFRKNNRVESEWINGGYLICNKVFFSYLSSDESCILEQDPLNAVAHNGQLMVYKHSGFWQCMDTLRDHQLLESLWPKEAPWKIWTDSPKEFIPAAKSSPQEQELQELNVTHNHIQQKQTIV
jgi:glucose-1-phosphate cytidylyltransferase